ncbi:MAG: type II toxin-antitoxin system VapC family toxin [Thermoanaerobaculia bacterium]
MIVVDASVVCEGLFGSRLSSSAREVLFDRGESLHAPHLIDLEVAQVVRRYNLKGSMSDQRAAQAIDDFLALPIERFAHEVFLRRIWELRANITAYDAAYIALAEALDIPLVTCDERLSSAPGHGADIELIER